LIRLAYRRSKVFLLDLIWQGSLEGQQLETDGMARKPTLTATASAAIGDNQEQLEEHCRTRSER
jgi:hypothetical protein